MARDDEEVYSLSDLEGASAVVSRPPLQLGKCALTKTDSLGFQIPSSMCYMHCTHQPHDFIYSVSQLVDAGLSPHLGSHRPCTSSIHVITLLLCSLPESLTDHRTESEPLGKIFKALHDLFTTINPGG